jgi:hypothetical protein
LTPDAPEADRRADGEADRAHRTLWTAVLVFRWAALAWMSVMALTAARPFVRSELAWLSLGAALAWTAWLTVGRDRVRRPALWFDLALAVGLVLVSGLVVPEDQVGERQLFATAYPAAAALAWGVTRGPWGGLAAGAILGAAYALTRPLNGTPFTRNHEDGTDLYVVTVEGGRPRKLTAGDDPTWQPTG